MQCGACSSSPERARDGASAVAEFPARERREGESGRVQALEGDAVEVMHAFSVDERGQRRHKASNVAETLLPVGHVDGDDVHSEFALLSDRATLALIIFQTMAN